MSFIFGGGGSAPAASSGTTQAITREAPKELRLENYPYTTKAAKLASTPVNLPLCSSCAIISIRTNWNSTKWYSEV